MLISKKQASLLTILTWLTLLAIIAQISLFIIHYQVSELVDSFVQSSLSSQLLHSVIVIPIILFISIQLISYALFIAWIWFISSPYVNERSLGIAFWLVGVTAIITFNNYYFSDSFFASLFREKTGYNEHINLLLLRASLVILTIATLVAYLQFFIHRRNLVIGSLFLLIGFISLSFSAYDKWVPKTKVATIASQPNVILIGLDSLRPDFTSYFGNASVHTPNIDALLQSSSVFTQAYSPLARTFPAWISILTAKYPKHNHARSNLANPDLILPNDTLAKRLQQQGYETTYGTDEKRFSNITPHYGFDHLIGPHIGANDFLLGGLSDFPLTNLLINTELGKYLFPYNYANRAAAITYSPNSFLKLVQLSLNKIQTTKPQFIAIHLCISHWPFTWAHDNENINLSLAERYKTSVEAVDNQLGALLSQLKEKGLLDNAIIVLLSDHGATVGLPGDRIISTSKYQGEKNKINYITQYKLGFTPNQLLDLSDRYSINTSYGQGTDILSLKQNHVILAFKDTRAQTAFASINTPASLLDISPTILDLLQLNPIKHTDGISLKRFILHPETKSLASRPLFLETGYSLSEIETNNIFVNKVISKSIGAYAINPKNGFLYVKAEAEKSIIQNKQRAVLIGNWLLARYPASTRNKLALAHHKSQTMSHYTIPAYFVLANIKTGKWTIGLNDELSTIAPTEELLSQFQHFYGDEI